jgi:hypothetical protein
MNISELIERLQNVLVQYGDMEVIADYYHDIGKIKECTNCTTGEMYVNIELEEDW